MQKPSIKTPKLSLILPIYQNELNVEKTIPHYISALRNVEGITFELICVDDGSSDRSWELLKKVQADEPEIIKILKLTRNFGQAYSTFAGMSEATGDLVGTITSDMQDPIELISEMVTGWREGYKVVMAVPECREDVGMSSFFANIANWVTSKVINNNFPVGGYDFYIMDCTVWKELKKINEKNGRQQVLISWMGYSYKTIFYTRRTREAGQSTWTFKKKFNLIVDIFTTNTFLPLRLISIIGWVIAFFAFAYGLFAIGDWFLNKDSATFVKGWTTLTVLISFFSGAILIALGTLGEYIWRIFEYVKQRPSYLVEEMISFSSKEDRK